MREDIIMYFEKFYEIKGVDTSDSQAYFDTESWWVSNYGFQKYTSLQSFFVMKYRYLRFIQRRANENRNKGKI
jgi:hypothetical protein